MLIDTNVYLDHWPFRRLPLDEPAALLAKLREAGVTRAWAGSFHALLHRDVEGVNRRLVEACRRADPERLVPVGCVNPALPDWEEDLRRCQAAHGMRIVRLHPNYHGYALDAPEVARLLAAAAARGLVVQIPLTMEDERTQHPLVQVPHVDPAPLVELLPRVPGARVVLLNAFRQLRLGQAILDRLVATRQVWFDLAMLEGLTGVERCLVQVPPDRLLFGSYLPYFPVESALLKLVESPLPGAVQEAVRHESATALLTAAAGPS